MKMFTEKTFPKLVMKDWPMLTVTLPNDRREITIHAKEQDIELAGAESYTLKDGSPAPTQLRIGQSVTLTPKALSDFTRVVEETGVLDQGRSQKDGSRDE